MKKGLIFAVFCFVLILCGFCRTPAATFVVSNNANSGAGSLRQAVLDANAAATDDIIEFTSAMSGATITHSAFRNTDICEYI